MKQPEKYIRKAYLQLLAGLNSNGNPVPIYDEEVPEDVKPIPPIRVIMNNQFKNVSAETNCGHGWMCYISLDIICEQSRSFVNKTIVDDIEEQISNALDIWTTSHNEIAIPPFTVYYTRYAGSTPIILGNQTNTAVRRIVRYTHRLNGLD